jgi:hypothetical protein
MFLFTTPATAPAAAQPERRVPFEREMRQAAGRTGVSFDYLARTAERESRFDPAARAPTSSATGLFQFVDQTWLGLVRSEGPSLGLTREAAAIGSSGGRLAVTDPALRERILGLREDPSVASHMAGTLARRNADTLRQATGRPATDGELYMAHFLGAGGARELITLAGREPGAPAAARFPEAAAANRSVFFDAAGRARTVGEVHERLSAGFSRDAAAPAATEQAAAVPFFRDGRQGGRGPLTGLFRDSGAPVAGAVRDTWGGLARRERHAAAGGERHAFFPAATGTLSDADPPGAGASAEARVTVALPPQRPAGLVAADSPRPARRSTAAAPLDLLAFTTAGVRP